MKIVQIATICWLIVLGLVGLHQSVAVFMGAHGWKGLSPSDWASWVQAVGSIAAIIGSFRIAQRQTLAATLSRRVEQLELDAALIAACQHLVADTTKCLFNISKKYKAMEWDGHSLIGVERLVDLQQTYLALCMKPVPAAAFSLLLEAKKELAYTLTDVRDHNAASDLSADHRKKAASRLVRIRGIRNELLEHVSLSEIALKAERDR